MGLKDVIHYYFKCWGTVSGSKNDKYENGSWALSASLLLAVMLNECKFTPHLRRLSSMTEEEAIEIVKINEFKQYGGHPTERKYSTYENSFGQIVVSWGDGLKEKNIPQSKEVFDPLEFHYLLSKHFDLFSLIESNQAIDRDTLTNQSK